MRWERTRRSENVEDRRGMQGPVMVGGGMVTIVIVVVALMMGADPIAVLNQVNNAQQQIQQQNPQGANARPRNPEEEALKEFVAHVLGSTEDVWTDIFRQQEQMNYQKPRLVLFTGRVNSACGLASSAVGPFYCPGDSKVYLDLEFFRELQDRFNAPGDFAQAYVIAHEVGHHVQNQLGISQKVDEARRRLSKAQYNQLSVRLELQADFFAGVWAHHANKREKIIEPGDLEEALQAATAIGDDKLQMESQGYVVPDSFTHGTSAQRLRWFKKGFETGDIRQGDTFNARNL